MSKILDFIDMIFSFFKWGIDFIKQMFSLLSRAIPIIHDMVSFVAIHAPVLSYFFMLFLSFSVILFIWRLIP